MPTTVMPAPALAELLARPDELLPRELVLPRNTRMSDGAAGAAGSGILRG
jgi:hypothetical protein